MYEVEVKLLLLSPAALRDRLRRLGAAPGRVVVQTDRYLRHPCRDLAAGDEAFRVREEAGEGVGGPGPGAGAPGVRWQTTYKGPRVAAGQKARVEHDLDVGSDPIFQLEALGFEVVAGVRKRREPWSLQGLTVALDEVEGLGWFVEVECISDEVEVAGRRVEAAVGALGLVGADRFRESYLELALAAGVAIS